MWKVKKTTKKFELVLFLTILNIRGIWAAKRCGYGSTEILQLRLRRRQYPLKFIFLSGRVGQFTYINVFFYRYSLRGKGRMNFVPCACDVICMLRRQWHRMQIEMPTSRIRFYVRKGVLAPLIRGPGRIKKCGSKISWRCPFRVYSRLRPNKLHIYLLFNMVTMGLKNNLPMQILKNQL
jgi:hypothetical protein